jgi:hypothetical protein
VSRSSLDQEPTAMSLTQPTFLAYLATQAAISANKNEALGRAEDAADSLKGKAQAGAAALSEVKDDVKGPFDEERKAMGNPGAAPVEALIKNSWVDFKLEKVEPYNHNTKM